MWHEKEPIPYLKGQGRMCSSIYIEGFASVWHIKTVCHVKEPGLYLKGQGQGHMHFKCLHVSGPISEQSCHSFIT